MNTELPFTVGDVLEQTSGASLASKVRITEITDAHFKAEVLVGDNTREPLTVFRAGWFLYAKIANSDACLE